MIKKNFEHALIEARDLFLSGKFASSYKILIKLEHGGYGSCFGALLLSQIFLRKGALYHAKFYVEKALADKEFEGDALATKVEILLRQGNIFDAKKSFAEYLASSQAVDIVKEIMQERINLAAGDFETALVNIAEVSVSNRNFRLAREVFSMGFEMLRACGDRSRYQDLLDGLGLSDAREDHSMLEPLNPPHKTIDIIIPVYNALIDLKSCLESIERWREPCQNKLILVDDFSDDDTRQFLKAYMEDHQNIVLIRNEVNLGFTRSVIKGIEASTSPYFLLLNSDTIVMPGWLSGLWCALASDIDAALAGPLSNNAFCQSLVQPDFDWVAIDAGDLLPQKIGSLVKAYGKRHYPRLPFLSGFCLLVERAAYNACGGLDEVRYPFGYWEVQDLALKLIDMGRYGVVADDVYVHHRSGGSSNQEKRARHISDGLRELASSYGSIRVLSAEEVSRSNAVILDMIMVVSEFIDKSHREVIKEDIAISAPIPRAQAPRVWLTIENSDFLNKDVCIFAAYAPDGVLPTLTQSYLRAFRENGFTLVVSLACCDLNVIIDPSWSECADFILMRENSGFDFGSWADVLHDLPGLWGAHRLLFANDSVIPVKSVDKTLQDVRLSDAGFFAMTDCYLGEYHAQSYFFGWAGTNVQSPALKGFWDDVEYFSTKAEVISTYEKKIIHLSECLPNSTTQILFPLVGILGQAAVLLEEFSITHQGWRALLESGFPFVKSQLLLEGEDIISDVAERSEVSLGELLTHAEIIRFNRS